MTEEQGDVTSSLKLVQKVVLTFKNRKETQ